MLVRVCEANNRPVGRSSPISFDDTPSKVATGKAVASYSYDPYGAILTKSGSLADLNPLRYRGYYYDTETGFYYLQSRYYDPALGRFINGDSYASTGQGYLGFNMFAYCNNNPVNSTDPSGHVCVNLEFWMECTGGCNVGGGSMMGAGMTAVGAVAIAGAAGGGRSILDTVANGVKKLLTTAADIVFSKPVDKPLTTTVQPAKSLSDIASQYGLYECKEASEAMARQDKRKGAIVKLTFPARGFVVAENSRFGNEAISQNGVHYGYKDAADIVHCNVFPAGLPFAIWVNSFSDYTSLPPTIKIIPLPL